MWPTADEAYAILYGVWLNFYDLFIMLFVLGIVMWRSWLKHRSRPMSLRALRKDVSRVVTNHVEKLHRRGRIDDQRRTLIYEKIGNALDVKDLLPERLYVPLRQRVGSLHPYVVEQLKSLIRGRNAGKTWAEPTQAKKFRVVNGDRK
jgi:hypothetical protein